MLKTHWRMMLFILFLFLGFVEVVPAAPIDADELAASTRSLLEKMVAANTSNPPGNEARIVKIVSARLKKFGIPFEITEFAPGRQNIVTRLKGSGSEKPILLIAHIDVVGTDHQEWTVPKHQMTEKDGYLYGRGVNDDLGMAALSIELLIALKETKTPLRRDVIVALTGDEESGGAGIQYILKHKPESVGAALALNEGGGIVLGENGQIQRIDLQVAEKVYQDFKLSVTGTTGHSSAPLKDNAITRLSAALSKLGAYERPARLMPATRAYFRAQATIEKPEIAKAMEAIAKSKGALPAKALKVLEANPSQLSLLRTTCVATMLGGGNRENALPAEAHANVNCRILPDEKPEEIRSDLARVIADPTVKIQAVGESKVAEASPLDGEGPVAIQKIAKGLWPNILIIPYMSNGATDSHFLRNAGIPSYGISPIATAEADDRRAHGIDERIPVASLRTGAEYFSKLVLEIAAVK